MSFDVSNFDVYDDELYESDVDRRAAIDFNYPHYEDDGGDLADDDDDLDEDFLGSDAAKFHPKHKKIGRRFHTIKCRMPLLIKQELISGI